MTAAEADQFLAHYRSLLKAWVMATAGIGRSDADEIYRKLEDGLSTLGRIAIDFPDRAFTAETLMRSRSRSPDVLDAE